MVIDSVRIRKLNTAQKKTHSNTRSQTRRDKSLVLWKNKSKCCKRQLLWIKDTITIMKKNVFIIFRNRGEENSEINRKTKIMLNSKKKLKYKQTGFLKFLQKLKGRSWINEAFWPFLENENAWTSPLNKLKWIRSFFLSFFHNWKRS